MVRRRDVSHGRSVGSPRPVPTPSQPPDRVGRSAIPDATRSPPAGPTRVGRSDPPGSEPGPRGRPGRSVGDEEFQINFAPPYSDWFSIKSGVAQGCPLSPLLFLLVAETLKIATAQNSEFHGIEIGGRRIKTSQFADDTTLFLRDARDLTAAEASILKWCSASGMRENYKKREGLAMGRYRRGRRARTLPQSVTWVKEGMWAIVLGVPIGNDVNHDAFWKKKITAIQGKTQRMVGLFRASYFGRNLIVQAKYFGSLRYWLYSIPMSKATQVTVQMDADTLWWSKTPSLDEPRTRV